MPDINLAPSPSPMVTPADPAQATKAPTTDGVSAADHNDTSAPTFAATLKQQMAQPAETKTAKSANSVDALLAAVAALDGTQAAAPIVVAPEDAIAFLAPMLPGIAAAETDSEDKPSVGDLAGETDPEALIAAPLAIAVVAANLAPVADEAAAQAAAADDKQAVTSAIIAADTGAAAEAAADAGKAGRSQQMSFDALLNAAREASATAAGNAATHASQPTAASATNKATIPVTTPVGAPGWDREVGEKVVWMANRLDSRAELVLNPPNMGRIEVSLSISGDQANATFVSANPAVREALENAVPRLREILQQAGISLGQTQVGAESFQQSADKRENGDNFSRANGRSDDAANALPGGLIAGGTSTHWLRRGNGLVDTFA